MVLLSIDFKKTADIRLVYELVGLYKYVCEIREEGRQDWVHKVRKDLNKKKGDPNTEAEVVVSDVVVDKVQSDTSSVNDSNVRCETEVVTVGRGSECEVADVDVLVSGEEPSVLDEVMPSRKESRAGGEGIELIVVKEGGDT